VDSGAGIERDANSYALEEAAYRLGRLEALRWWPAGDQLSRYGFGSIDHQLNVELTGGDNRTVPPFASAASRCPAGRVVPPCP